MNTEKLIEAVEEELLPYASYMSRQRGPTTREMPDPEAIRQIILNVILPIYCSMVAAYGYDLIRPMLKKIGLVEDDSAALEARVDALVSILREAEKSSVPSDDLIKKTAAEALIAAGIPRDKIQEISTSIISRVKASLQ